MNPLPLLIFLLALVISTFLTLRLRDDPGYVLASYGDWSIETSLFVFTALALTGFGLLHLSLRFLFTIWAAPRRLQGLGPAAAGK